MIAYHDGFKYQLVEPWEWELQEDFGIKLAFANQYYGVQYQANGKWLLQAYPGCAWDGATWFPDFKWMMEGSLGHDILHWLIAKEVIPESKNDLIDKELERIIRARAPLPRFGGEALLKVRSGIVRRGTNLVDQKAGETKPVIRIGRKVNGK